MGVPFTPQGITRVYFSAVGGITTTAPTVAQGAAWTDITDFITDGPPTPAGASFVNAGTLDSGFESQVASVYGGGSGTMTILVKRVTTDQTADADTVFALFPQNTVGYLVVATFGVGGSDVVAADDEVDIIPIEVANRSRNISRGSLVAASIDLAFNGEPSYNVAVVA